MPLAFTTLNRGAVPFGFFNVKSDMVLLAQYFAFAEEVCGWIEELAVLTGPGGRGAVDAPRDAIPGLVELRKPVWSINDRERLGDFHGAMAGTALWGFFGAVYRRFPFPTSPEDFHQEPDGWRTQGELRLLADEWALPAELFVVADSATGTIDLGGYRFDPPGFASLVGYLWQGGAPRWMGGIRPDYVERMMGVVRSADSWLFAEARRSA